MIVHALKKREKDYDTSCGMHFSMLMLKKKSNEKMFVKREKKSRLSCEALTIHT